MSEEEKSSPYPCWTSKLHKLSYKHSLSCLLTKLLYYKGWIGEVFNTKTSRNGVSNMWILENSTSLFSIIDQLDDTTTSVQKFDFSTLYTSMPQNQLKSRINNLVHAAFRQNMGVYDIPTSKLPDQKGTFTHDINGG